MRSYKSRGARLTAALTGVAKTERTLDDDQRELLRQTRKIHSLEARRRTLKREVAAITKELRARRRGLRLFTIAMALRTSAAAREEFDSANMEGS